MAPGGDFEAPFTALLANSNLANSNFIPILHSRELARSGLLESIEPRLARVLAALAFALCIGGPPQGFSPASACFSNAPRVVELVAIPGHVSGYPDPKLDAGDRHLRFSLVHDGGSSRLEHAQGSSSSKESVVALGSSNSARPILNSKSELDGCLLFYYQTVYNSSSILFF